MDTNALRVGFFEILAAEGVCTWAPGSVTADPATGAVLGVLPDSPDKAIALGTFDLPPIGGGDQQLRLTMLTRGTKDNPTDVDDLTKDAIGVLNGLGGRLVGGIWVVDTVVQSSAALSADGNQRPRRTTHFFVTASLDSALSY